MEHSPTFAALSVFCSTAVGVVFLVTGGLKGLSPSTFYLRMERLKVLPFAALRWVIGGTAVLQCILGLSLMCRLYTGVTLPLSAVLLMVLGSFSAWSWVARGASECGCYGGMLAVSSAKSLALDALYLGMIAFAWSVPVSFGWSPRTEWTLLFEPALVFASVIFMSSWVYRKWGADMVVLTPLRVNKPWNTGWLDGYEDLPRADHRLIVLMSPTCSACAAWTKPLNKIHRRRDMPQIVAAMAGDAPTRTAFAAEHGLEFPLLAVSVDTMDRLARAFPTVVEVNGDRIVTAAEGALPAYLLDRLRHSPSGIPVAAPQAFPPSGEAAVVMASQMPAP